MAVSLHSAAQNSIVNKKILRKIFPGGNHIWSVVVLLTEIFPAGVLMLAIRAVF